MSVDVIIPCHNVDAYIDECLASVIQQVHSVNSIICVDNNSTDSTLEKLQEWQKRDKRIQVLEEPKRGASAARNCGLHQSNAEWIQFLDADDLLLSDKLIHQIKLLNDTQDGTNFIAGACIRRKISGREIMVIPIDDHWKGLFVNQLGNTCSNLWRRSALFAVDGWNENLKSSQESDLMFRMMSVGHSRVLIDTEPLTIIRERSSGQISKQNTGQNLRRYANLRLDICEHLKQQEPVYWEREKSFFIHNVFILMMRLWKEKQTNLAYQISTTILADNPRSMTLKENSLCLLIRFLFRMKMIKIKN